MTMNRDLFLAILSLDAYNRGYNPGISGMSDAAGTAIGDASIVKTGEDSAGVAKSAGFYAVAYTWNGEKVISYRGTTFELGTNTLKDVFYGWTLGIGFDNASQANLALQFYQDVTGQSALSGKCGWGQAPERRHTISHTHAPLVRAVQVPVSDRACRRPSS